MITTSDKENNHYIQSQKTVILDITMVSNMYLYIYEV